MQARQVQAILARQVKEAVGNVEARQAVLLAQQDVLLGLCRQLLHERQLLTAALAQLPPDRDGGGGGSGGSSSSSSTNGGSAAGMASGAAAAAEGPEASKSAAPTQAVTARNVGAANLTSSMQTQAIRGE